MIVVAACAGLAVALMTYTFWSHLQTTGDQLTDLARRRAYLEERKEAVYENLRDLNFEHRAGKLSDQDFESQRAALESEAAGILAELSTLESAS
jgi:hypothetical protein